MSQSQTSTVSIAGAANPTPTFSMADGVASVAQIQLSNISASFQNTNPNAPQPIFETSPLAANGSLASAPTVGASGSTYLYLSGQVTSGGSVSLTAANGGFSGIFATFSGNETITGGAGSSQLLATSAQTNLTWDPQGGLYTDSIIAGGGNNNFTLDGARYDVVASAGRNTITAAKNVVGAPTSYNSVTTTGGNNTINLDAGQNAISSGGNDTINVANSGNAITTTGAADVAFASTASGNSLVASGSDTINVANSGNAITTTGAADVTFASTAGGNSLVAGGTTTVRDHGSNDHITLEGSASLINGGSGNHVTIGGGKQNFITGNNNLVSASTVPASVALFGQANTIIGGGGGTLYAYGSNNLVNASGKDTVCLNGQNNMVTDLNGHGGIIFAGSKGTTGVNSVNAGGSVIVASGGSGTSDSVTLQGGATELALGSTTVDATGSNWVLLTKGGNTATINGSSTAVNYSGGANTITAAGGTVFNDGGSLNFIGHGIIEPGSGSVTAHGSGGDLKAFGGSGGNNLLVGGSANNTLLGAGSGDTLEGGSGNNLIVGGAGAETMTGGANATLNTFDFLAQRDHLSVDTITNFNAANDKIQLLLGLTVTNTTVTGGNLSMTLSDNTKLTLLGVSAPLSSSTSGTTTSLV